MNQPIPTIEVSDLPQNHMLQKQVYSKPYVAIYIVLIVGIIILVTRTSIWPLGLIMTLLALFGLFCVKGTLQLEIYDDYAVVYLPNPNQCQMFKWSDTEEWGVHHDVGADFLNVKLKNGDMMHTLVNNSGRVYSALLKKIPDQESSRIVQERINKKREEPFKGFGPFKKKK